MSSKITLSEVKTSNSQITSETAPSVAVFVGATAGIGKATLSRLAAQGTVIKIYVVGRNAAKHQAWVQQLQDSCKKAQIIFVEGEISLMSEVKRICDEIKAKESSIDALFLSQAYIPYNGREMTSEGLDLFSALGFYGRLLFMLRLLPLLKASRKNSRIVNLGGAGREKSDLCLEDLDLQKPGNYTMWKIIDHVATCMTLSLLHMAEENPDVTFIWNMPGLVATDIHAGSAFSKWYMKPLFWAMGISAQDAGERSIFLLTSARFGGNGVPLQRDAKQMTTMKRTTSGSLFSLDANFKALEQEKVLAELQSQNAGRRVWEHSEHVLGPYL